MLSAHFDDVETALQQQKDDAVLYARLCVGKHVGSAEDVQASIERAL